MGARKHVEILVCSQTVYSKLVLCRPSDETSSLILKSPIYVAISYYVALTLTTQKGANLA